MDRPRTTGIRRREKHSPLTKSRAFKLYVVGNATRNEVADELGVPMDTVQTWIRKEGWTKQRRDLYKTSIQGVLRKCAKIVEEEREAVLRRHIKASGMLEDKIIETLEKLEVIGPQGGIRTDKLLDLAKALKASSEVSSESVGLDRKSDPRGTGIGLIVQVGVNPSMPESNTPKAIDVTAKEHEDPF